MTPFDASQRLRALASQCENLPPRDAFNFRDAVEDVADAIGDVAEELRGQAERVG